VYLHYVLDLWFERVVKSRLRGEAYLGWYIDDFVLCLQYRADALRVQNALCKRLGKFSLTLEPTKTQIVEFGRFADKYASKRGRKRPETRSAYALRFGERAGSRTTSTPALANVSPNALVNRGSRSRIT
jgi:hypothetical protein